MTTSRHLSAAPALPATYAVGDAVTMFPAIAGEVVAVERRPGHKYGDRYTVRTAPGVEHTVSESALLPTI